MEKVHYTKTMAVLLAGMMLIISCKKNFLDKKPSSDLVVPTTLEDFQALLDNDNIMASTPALGDLCADNYALDSAYWQGLDIKQHNAYIWANNIFNGLATVDDWNMPYEQVFYANVVLDGLPGVQVTDENRQEWNTVKGEALFIRAYAFWNLAQVFGQVYNGAEAQSDTGIVLRLTSDVNPVSTVVSVKQTYDQILSDLQQASALLPQSIPFGNLNRPSKPAALAMLARVFLSMSSYDQAKTYVDSCFNYFYSTLVDYNTVSKTASFPFRTPNAEILYESHIVSSASVLWGLLNHCTIDANLFASYDSTDLRKVIYYSVSGGKPGLKASYNGSIFAFSGLATDELYLIRAECYARENNVPFALNDVNTLLLNRYATGTFTAYTAGTAPDLLGLVLAERRKELAFRGLRWSDLRRLNLGMMKTTLYRHINSATYSLSFSDPRYKLPTPPDVKPLSYSIH